MRIYCTFVLVPHGTDLTGLADWQVRDDNVTTPGGRMLLLRVGSPETVEALRKVKDVVELGTNLDAPAVKAGVKVSDALSLSSGTTVREKISGRFGPEYDPLD